MVYRLSGNFMLILFPHIHKNIPRAIRQSIIIKIYVPIKYNIPANIQSIIFIVSFYKLFASLVPKVPAGPSNPNPQQSGPQHL